MSKDLIEKIRDLVDRYQIDRAYQVLWSRGLTQFQAGWLIQKALKESLEGSLEQHRNEPE